MLSREIKFQRPCLRASPKVPFPPAFLIHSFYSPNLNFPPMFSFPFISRIFIYGTSISSLLISLLSLLCILALHFQLNLAFAFFNNRLFLYSFKLPGEAQKIDRIMEAFAAKYYSQYSGNIFKCQGKLSCSFFPLLFLLALIDLGGWDLGSQIVFISWHSRLLC